MKLKKNNQRTCLVTKQVQDKDLMIRIVKTKDGEILVNSDAQGRGAYVSNDVDIIPKLTKQKSLHRAFRINVQKEKYDELIKTITEANNER